MIQVNQSSVIPINGFINLPPPSPPNCQSARELLKCVSSCILPKFVEPNQSEDWLQCQVELWMCLRLMVVEVVAGAIVRRLSSRLSQSLQIGHNFLPDSRSETHTDRYLTDSIGFVTHFSLKLVPQTETQKLGKFFQHMPPSRSLHHILRQKRKITGPRPNKTKLKML